MRPMVWLVLFALYAIAEFALFIWVASLTSWFVVLLLLVLGGVVGAIVMSRAGTGEHDCSPVFVILVHRQT